MLIHFIPGDWKLYAKKTIEDDLTNWEIYDLIKDPGEINNLASPEK